MGRRTTQIPNWTDVRFGSNITVTSASNLIYENVTESFSVIKMHATLGTTRTTQNIAREVLAIAGLIFEVLSNTNPKVNAYMSSRCGLGAMAQRWC